MGKFLALVIALVRLKQIVVLKLRVYFTIF